VIRTAAARLHGARARGFTLLEVVVALAIVTIGMAALLGALSSSTDTVSYLRDKTFAQWVALNQIATLRLSGQQAQPGDSDGDTDYAGRTWHWRQEVTATEVPGVVRIDVKVRPKDLKVADEDSGWFTTVSGIQGDAVGAPNGYLPDWGSQTLPGLTPQVPGVPGSLGGRAGAVGAIGTLGSPAAGGIGTGQPPSNVQ
jgi:general secretion pathway protein I